MKKYFIFLFALFFIFDLKAEGHRSPRKSNPNYKNLKLYVKVLERYGKSDCYLTQIDIVNIGNSSVSFHEIATEYSLIFGFTAAGIRFVDADEHLYFEKKLIFQPPEKAIDRMVRILPHNKYIIKTQIHIKNRKRFLETNKNLRLEFHFNDANLGFKEDESCPRVISENIINYRW
jgi:hypothetical protein